MIKKLEKGDWIKCHNEKELKNWLSMLGRNGIGAVVSPGLYILITSTPEGEEEYDGSV